MEVNSTALKIGRSATARGGQLEVNRTLQAAILYNAVTNRASAIGDLSTDAGGQGESLTFDVWYTSGELDPNELPERELLKNPPGRTTGICLSGGGSRAAAAAVGFLRGLIQLGLMENVDYATACSGGAYTLAPFQYYRTGAEDDRVLLGPIKRAQDLTHEALQDAPEGGLIRCLTRPILSRFASELVMPSCLDGSHADEAWLATMASIFLEPYGVGDKHTPVAASAAHAARIRERNPHLRKSDIVVRREGRPVDIFTGTLAPPVKRPAGDAKAVVWETEDFVPYDMTPLYCGSAISRVASLETYRAFARARDDAIPADATWEYTVGGFVESFAVGATLAPSSAPPPAAAGGGGGGSQPVSARARAIGRSARVMSLAKMLDASSNAYCGITNNTGAREAVLSSLGVDIGSAYSRLAYWAPAQLAGAAEGGGAPPSAQSVYISDAGGHDLLAILPLLTRSVRKMVVFSSLGTPIATGFPLDGGPDGTEWKGVEGDLDGNLPAYFGIRAKSCEHMMHSLREIQVFQPADFWLLMKRVRAKLVDGDFPVVTMDHQVLPNAFWGIRGGYSVRVCWAFLQRVTRWEAKLPAEIRDAIETSATSGEGEFAHFPNYLVTGQNKSLTGLDMHLTAAQANLSSQLATAYVMENAQAFTALLGDGAAGAPAADEAADDRAARGTCGCFGR